MAMPLADIRESSSCLSWRVDECEGLLAVSLRLWVAVKCQRE